MVGRRVVIAAVFLAVAVSTSVLAAGAAKPKPWVMVTNFWPEGVGPSVSGSAAGRAWIGFASDRSRTRLGSIRRVGGRLSFVRTDVVSQIPMMIVEHHMDLVRAVAHRVLGLASGWVALQGPTSEVLASEQFRATMTGEVSVREQKVATTDV